MFHCNQSAFAPQCTATSVGVANQLFLTLFQTLLTAQCNISPASMWPQDYGKIALEKGLGEYDFIVVGAGSAGAIVATRLSEISNWKVLLLEAGGNPPIESVVPSLAYALFKTRADWNEHTKSTRACKLSGTNKCYLPHGKMLGGSSSINSMIFVRGNEHDFSEWAGLGNPGWEYENVLPYFKKYEGNQNPTLVEYMNGKYHNANGPVKIDNGPVTPTDAVIVAALREAGVPFIDDINSDKMFGYFLLQSTAYNGRRSSTAEAFLAPAKDRRNLHVITHAFVNRILIDKNNEVKGVEFTHKKKHKMRAYSRKEVVVSAGAIQSPPLLMRSGIGPRAHLEENKIPVKADLPAGDNYIDHVFGMLLFASNISTSSASADPLSAIDSWYQYNIQKTGMGTASSISALISSSNSTAFPDIQIFCLTYQRGILASTIESFATLSGLGNRLNEIALHANKQSDLTVVVIGVIKPQSRGFIRLNKCPKCKKANIFGNYFVNPSDRATMIRAIKQQIASFNTEPFRKLGTTFVRIPIAECDAFEYQSDDYWECYIKWVSNAGFHQTGTSKMGTDTKAVVDPRCRVYKVRGLRQADAGIIPVAISANTNAASMMVGERCSDFIKQDHLIN